MRCPTPVEPVKLTIFTYNIYFLLRFSLANNVISNYLRLKICIVCVGIFFFKCLEIEFVIQNLSQKNLKRMF